jgi:hypothetical protein
MSLSAFTDKTRMPTDDDLRPVLGRAYASWTTLLDLVAERIDPINELWGYTSASTGWGLRVRHRERVILYMTPQENQFLVSFALGEKAVAAAHAAKLPAALLKAIDGAPRYAEGRGVRLEIKGSRQLASLAKLAEIKWRN